MTVKQLKTQLQSVPDHYLVVQSSDGEGNSYSPTNEGDMVQYVAETSWSGQVKHPNDQTGPNNAFCLWPTN